jgi:Fe-S cluster assembly protein SufD
MILQHKTWQDNFMTLEAALIESDEFRKQNWQSFLDKGFPNNSDEEWKYFNFEELFAQTISPVYAENQIDSRQENSSQTFVLPECEENQIVLENGQIKSQKILNKQIIIASLDQAFNDYSDLKVKYLNQASQQNIFTLQNNSLWQGGLFFYMPANTVLNQPIQISLLSNSPNCANYSRNLIIIEDNCQAEIFIYCSGSNSSVDELYLHNLINQIIIGENSQVKIFFVQNESKNAFQIAYTDIKLQNNSNLDFYNLSFGAKTSKHLIQSDFLGEGINHNLKGLYVLKNSQTCHNQVIFNHNKPNCSSNQLFKGILNDKSRAEFSGIIKVKEKANGTAAKQLNKNLLLSPEAKVDTRPQLEIKADDVKCSHGATIGQLQSEEIFYLLSRGISREKALEILTFGFAEEIIETISIPSLKSFTEKLLTLNL